MIASEVPHLEFDCESFQAKDRKFAFNRILGDKPASSIVVSWGKAPMVNLDGQDNSYN